MAESSENDKITLIFQNIFKEYHDQIMYSENEEEMRLNALAQREMFYYLEKETVIENLDAFLDNFANMFIVPDFALKTEILIHLTHSRCNKVEEKGITELDNESNFFVYNVILRFRQYLMINNEVSNTQNWSILFDKYLDSQYI